jgi:hypothetical protein
MPACSSCNFLLPVEVRFCPRCGAEGPLKAGPPEESSAGPGQSEVTPPAFPSADSPVIKAPPQKSRRSTGGKRSRSSPSAVPASANELELSRSTSPIATPPLASGKQAADAEPVPQRPDPSPPVRSNAREVQGAPAEATKRAGGLKTIAITAVILMAVIGAAFMFSRPRLDQAQGAGGSSRVQPQAEPSAPAGGGGNCSERDRAAGLCMKATP